MSLFIYVCILPIHIRRCAITIHIRICSITIHILTGKYMMNVPKPQ